MTVLIELKEKLKEFYGSCSGIVLPIVKFLLGLAVFLGINAQLGYLKVLNSMYVVLILSLLCAILPLNGMVFLAMLVILGHCFALHMVIAGLVALVLLVLWFLYLRFVPKDAPALLLTPLAFWIHIPSAVPVSYGLAGTPLSAFSTACGVVVYYMCSMIHGKMEPMLHAAETPEIAVMVQEFFNGLFRNEEMLLVIIACALTILLVNVIRHSSADYAWQISIVAGSVAYAVIMIAGSLALDVQIALPSVLIGAAAGCLVGFILEFFLFGADYTRTEYLEFDDDDYYYYVKAIPKFTVTKAHRRVTYIRDEKKEEPDLTDDELDALASVGSADEKKAEKELIGTWEDTEECKETEKTEDIEDDEDAEVIEDIEHYENAEGIEDIEKYEDAEGIEDVELCEETEGIEETEEIEEFQKEEIPPLEKTDDQNVDYEGLLEDTLKEL